MRRRNLQAGMLLLLISAVTNGCVIADGPVHQRSQVKLRIDSDMPGQWVLEFADGSVSPVGSDGRVAVKIPRLGRESATYFSE